MPSLFRRPVRRTRSGRYALNLSAGERAVLRSLAPQLQAALADPNDPGLRRLFPPAYGETVDADKQEEYARLMQEDLVKGHGATLAVLEQTASSDELSPEELEAWVRALNHLRLVIGTRLDVTEADDAHTSDDPEHQLYYYLGYLQECVVEALSGEG